ncbi:hypothetical protein A9996_15775 [Gelidibacter algens]|nr:hypothetical protein A9996_15775 [Gelidibacter algens]
MGFFVFWQLLKHHALRCIFSFFRKKEKDAAAIVIANVALYKSIRNNYKHSKVFLEMLPFNLDIL